MSIVKETTKPFWDLPETELAVVPFARAVDPREERVFQFTMRVLNTVFFGSDDGWRGTEEVRSITIGQLRDTLLRGEPQPPGLHHFNPSGIQQTAYRTKKEKRGA